MTYKFKPVAQCSRLYQLGKYSLDTCPILGVNTKHVGEELDHVLTHIISALHISIVSI